MLINILPFFISIILILNPTYSFAKSGKIIWKDQGFNRTDQYIQEYYKGFKEVDIGGKLITYDISFFSTFPNVKKNQKNWECREWTIEEFFSNKKYIYKIYSLNDCLPCLNKGSGYLCSYPYFRMELKSKLYDKILTEKVDDRFTEFMEDGTNRVKLSINLSSREVVEIVEQKLKKNGKKMLGSRLIKYNTKYRKIPSEGSEPITVTRDLQSALLFLTLFPRLKSDVNLSIEKKEKLNLREKDINTLIRIEPAVKKMKFQTRD